MIKVIGGSAWRLFRRVFKTLLLWTLGATVILGAILLATAQSYRSADSHLVHQLSVRTVNDITALNPVQVGRVATPKSADEIAHVLASTSTPVSIGGARNSQGGQISHSGSLHLDMRQMNRVLHLDRERRTVTVEAGIRWRDLIEHIDPYDLSIRIMQTYSNFTVGGTLSVNAHGRYMGQGPVVLSVLSLKLVLANGSILEASRDQNADLFWGVMGGYGGLAVIAEATLQLTENHKVERTSRTMDTTEYGRFFNRHVRKSKSIVFHNADLHPPDFDTLRAVSWSKTDKSVTTSERLIPRNDSYSMGRLLDLSLSLPLGFAIRKHILEPWMYRERLVSWRNHEASYDIQELDVGSRESSTFVLQEYFVPVRNFDAFRLAMRNVFQENNVQVANVSIRHAIADPGTLLSWANEEVFAFVVYYKQGTDEISKREVRKWTREMIDAVLAEDGTYYLPYQVHATQQQFRRSYPKADQFFDLKRRVDPDYRFRNSLWETYYATPPDFLSSLDDTEDYEKPESQTLLTIPEWYLVFNPKEYADFLGSNQEPHRFPFFQSVKEYWSLYKKCLRSARGVYPDNDEYLTMLRVIGVSTSAEYFIKGIYEKSIGAFFYRLQPGTKSREDLVIRDAHRAYSDFIYDDVWYAFDFMSWVKRMWTVQISGMRPLRRLERRLAFTIEFVVKAGYAKLIEAAAKASFDAPEERVMLVVSTPSTESLDVDSRLEIVRRLEAHRFVVSVPRWGPFTEIVLKLAQRGVDFVEIAGNDDIALTLASQGVVQVEEAAGQTLASSKFVTRNDIIRTIVMLRVDQLGKSLRQFRKQRITVEHLYDY